MSQYIIKLNDLSTNSNPTRTRQETFVKNCPHGMTRKRILEILFHRRTNCLTNPTTPILLPLVSTSSSIFFQCCTKDSTDVPHVDRNFSSANICVPERYTCLIKFDFAIGSVSIVYAVKHFHVLALRNLARPWTPWNGGNFRIYSPAGPERTFQRRWKDGVGENRREVQGGGWWSDIIMYL